MSQQFINIFVGAMTYTIVAIVMAVFNRFAMNKDRDYMHQLSSINDSLAGMLSDVKKTKQDMSILMDWHDKEDEDGRKLWYMPRSWADIQKQTNDTQLMIVSTVHLVQQRLEDEIQLQKEILEILREIHCDRN